MSGDVPEYKIVVLGGGGVGKSALTIRLVSDKFDEDYDPTIEDSYRKDAVVDGERVVMDILDTAGQEEFSSMQDQWIMEGSGFILVYSIANEQTFEEVKMFLEKIKRAKDSEKEPIVIAGNKCDLDAEYRKVTTEQGQEYANSVGMPFFETSAKMAINSERVFEEVVREIRKAENEKNNPKKDDEDGSKCCCNIL